MKTNLFFKIFFPIFILAWLVTATTVFYNGVKSYHLMTACADSNDPKSKECFRYNVWFGNLRNLNMNIQE